MAGVQWSSANTTVEAAVKVIPTPAAVILRRAALTEIFYWKLFIFFFRVSLLVLPSIFMY